MRIHLTLALSTVAAWAVPSLARAGTVQGLVFADANDDGAYQEGEELVSGATVVWEQGPFVATDAEGRFSIPAPDRTGLVWVRAPAGFSPAPTWVQVDATGGATADLALTPMDFSGHVRFVVSSDTHVGIGDFEMGDLERALIQATATDPRPNFVVITGDVTQSNTEDQFAEVKEAADTLQTPFVPVPGNHDWYDGGAAYREHLGPSLYSFNAGNAHFVVLEYLNSGDDSGYVDRQLTFLEADLANIPDNMPVIAFMHAPPVEALVTGLEEAGVDAVFSGHIHENRIHEHAGFREYSTQPLVMAGMDGTPAGYRLVTVTESGELEMEHRTIVTDPIAHIAYPREDDVVEPCTFRVIAAAETGAEAPELAARIDGGSPFPLTRQGGWVYEAEVELCAAGEHTVELLLTREGGNDTADERSFTIAEAEPLSHDPQDWRQYQRDLTRRGARDERLEPPLRTRWATSVGGQLHGGSPVLADDRVFVSIVDFADGTRGGVVALDAHTGGILWDYRSGPAVRSAPAVADGVVVASASDGTVHALDAATGERLWVHQLAPEIEPRLRSLYASPAIRNGVVYAGVRKHKVALDLLSGELVWEVKAEEAGDAHTHAAMSAGGGYVLGTFARGVAGLVAFDPDTGEEAWRTGRGVSVGSETSPVIVGDRALMANWETRLHSVDLDTGEVNWDTKLSDRGFGWGYGVTATPAAQGNLAFVPTTYDNLFAVDVETGEVAWTHQSDPALVHPAHYQSRARAFTSSPVVTGDLVWIGAPDGVLRAIDAYTGELQWSRNFGSPIMSGPAPYGDLLVVASYDGVVRALEGESVAIEQRPDPEATSGCFCYASGRGGPPLDGALLVAGTALWLWAPRSRRRRRSLQHQRG